MFVGGRTADEIVNWLLKKTGPPAKTLETAEDVKKFIEEPEVAVVAFLSSADSEAAKQYLAAAAAVDELPFAIVTDPEVAKANDVEGDAIVLFKKVGCCVKICYTGKYSGSWVFLPCSVQEHAVKVQKD